MQDNSRERFPEDIAILGARRETARQEFTMKNRILGLLREKGPLTVPEVALTLGIPTPEANWWLMGLWRYNQVSSGERTDDDGYYRYSPVEGQ